MSGESEISSDNIQDDTIVIREAKPDLEEGLIFAQLFDAASEGFFKSMLGIKTYEIIANAFVKSNNEYSYEHVMMIEYQSEIVGMVSGYTYAEKERFKQNILSQFPGGEKLRILMFSVVGNILSRFLGPRKKEDYYLQSIAVSSQIRRKGLGQRLMKHSEEIAIKKGSKTLSLDFSSKNQNAINGYKKFGMEISTSWPNLLKLPPVFTRMVKEL
jgi:ribosomal protein S18 acetylase RimI-like enzyme